MLFAAGFVASAVAKRLWRDKPLVRDRQGIIPRLRLAIGEKSLAKSCRLSHRPSSMAGIRRGRADIAANRTKTHKEVEKLVESWAAA